MVEISTVDCWLHVVRIDLRLLPETHPNVLPYQGVDITYTCDITIIVSHIVTVDSVCVLFTQLTLSQSLSLTPTPHTCDTGVNVKRGGLEEQGRPSE